LVTDLTETDGRLFVCEFCGAGYEAIEVAEDCEEHCAILGFTSAEIRRKAIHVPKIQVIPMQ
jgi:hypothetical protein